MSSQDEMIENRQVECDSDEDIDDNNDDWDEMENEEEPVQCLFCDEMNQSIEKAIIHLNAGHQIDLGVLRGKFQMDEYSYIKMINYIRTKKITPIQLLSLNECVWSDDIYLKPVIVDAWLMFDFDEVEVAADSNQEDPQSDGQKILELQRQLNEKDATIEQLLYQISQMQTTFRNWVDKSTDDNKSDAGVDEENQQTTVAEIPIKDDESYFNTYSHFSIHHVMLSDAVRTSSYRDAILLNKNMFNGKIVMDVGCGTSILSMFASQAGAKKVIAIDQSDIIYQAMDIAKRNKIENIEFVKGRLENITLPLAEGEKVDIIISEWMGYFLLFEGMLDSVIYARDKYLKSDGLLLPNRCTISIVASGDEERHSEYISFWKNVYGYDMTNMQSEVLKEGIVEVCRGEFSISEPVVVADLNLATVDYNYPNFVYDFELKINKTGKLTAFVGYFDTFFNLDTAVEFTTGPHATPTHWKQNVFYIKNPVPVEAGDVVKGKFQCRRGKNDARAICVKITAFNQDFYYSLN